MSVYYQDDLVTLYHGDCLEEPAWLAADALVSDPPYGMKYVSGWKANAIKGDATPEVRDLVLKKWGDRPAIIFGTWRVPRPENVRIRLIWNKGDWPGMGDLKLPWGPSDEEIYVIGKGFEGKRSGTILHCNRLPANGKNTPNHPTPKPIPLMEQLIEKCPPGAIADPFAGSGATLLAASNLGRKSIGVETEERYCELIATRLQNRVEAALF